MTSPEDGKTAAVAANKLLIGCDLDAPFHVMNCTFQSMCAGMQQPTAIIPTGSRTSPAEVLSTCGCKVRGAPPLLPGAGALFDRQVVHAPSVVQAVVKQAAGQAAIATGPPRFLHRACQAAFPTIGCADQTWVWYRPLRFSRSWARPAHKTRKHAGGAEAGQKAYLAEALHGLWQAIVHDRSYCTLQVAHPPFFNHPAQELLLHTRLSSFWSSIYYSAAICLPGSGVAQS